MMPFMQFGNMSTPEGAGFSTRPAGFDQAIFLDASVIESLRGEGYILEPTSISMEYAYTNFNRINKVVVGTKAVPALQDGSGNVYILDEKRNVFLLSKSRINQTTGLPGNISPSTPMVGTGGGGTTYQPPAAPIPPVIPSPVPPQIGNGFGGNSGGVTSTPMPPGGVIGSGKIYGQFNVDDIIPNQQETVTRALWTNNDGNLLTFFTSSTQTTTQKRYYYEIYNSGSTQSCLAQPQFSVAYGHKLGSGSADEGGQINDTPSRAIYGQYRLLCLSPTSQYFTIGGNTTEHIYAININRARMREHLDEGNIEICLAALSGSEFVAGGGLASAHTGSNVRVGGAGRVIRLVDDSSINSATIENGGEVYQIVSGSIEDGVYNSSAPHIYGQLFKRQGIIILDANKMDQSCSFATVDDREINGDNAYKLFTAISGAALYTDGSGDYLGFQGRSVEKVKSTHYFVRVKNSEFNFSNNPSFVTGSEGDLMHPSMINNPVVYITGIGLYNSRKELLAVAKTSQPIQKKFTKEALLKIKLDW